MLRDWDEYADQVVDAYEKAPEYDNNAVKYWEALNTSNYKLFNRLLSKIDVVFVTGDSKYKDRGASLSIDGRKFKVDYISGGQPYNNQSEMKQDVVKNGILKISIDHSNHPVFSVKDNIVFRTIHDYIVHILGNHPFGLKGEIASYNLHAKLAPKNALPALFTEVIGQVSYAVKRGDFPIQKIVVLDDFDFENVGYLKQPELAN